MKYFVYFAFEVVVLRLLLLSFKLPLVLVRQN